jgi:hypothetical protein
MRAIGREAGEHCRPFPVEIQVFNTELTDQGLRPNYKELYSESISCQCICMNTTRITVNVGGDRTPGLRRLTVPVCHLLELVSRVQQA